MIAHGPSPLRKLRSQGLRSGMSLLEVLLSLAIFLMAIVAIGQLVDLGTDSALDSQAQATGTRLAQSVLAEAEAGAISVQTSSSGTFDYEPDWQWQTDASPAGITGLYTVTVTVSREYRNRTFTVELTQMIFDPQFMGGAKEAQKPE